MGHEQSILTEIKHNLDDDAPRLILADWYSERNDSRGDFIRTQCEMASLDWDDPRYETLQTLNETLLAKHRAKWLKALPKLAGVAWGTHDLAASRSLWWAGRTYFRRGFVELVTYQDYAAYKKNAQSIADYGLVTHPQFLNMNAQAFETLERNPAMRGMSHRIWEADTEPFARFACREKLQALTLDECSLHNAGLSQLIKIEFPALQVLDLAYNRLLFSEVDLTRWKSLAKVQWLSLGGNDFAERFQQSDQRIADIGLAAMRRLLSIPFQNLFALRLNSSELSAPYVSEIAAAPSLKRLTELDLSWNDLSSESIPVLAKGKFPTLRHLHLGTNSLSDPAAISLAEEPSFHTLRRLNLRDNPIGDAGIEAIAQSPYLSNLTHLNIPMLNFGLGGINALIHSTTLNSIRYLNIGDIELNVKTLKDLQRRYPRAIVRKPYH